VSDLIIIPAALLLGILIGAFRVARWIYRALFSGTRSIIGRGAVPSMAAMAAGAGWQLMCVAARLMPRAAGRRWLAEAESFLAEAPLVLRRGAPGNYLASAPRVIMVSWAGELARRVRVTGEGPR
jgi:hypothetical protein